MDRWSNTEPIIDFTYELETNNTFYFLGDILVTNNNNKLRFKVDQKWSYLLTL